MAQLLPKRVVLTKYKKHNNKSQNSIQISLQIQLNLIYFLQSFAQFHGILVTIIFTNNIFKKQFKILDTNEKTSQKFTKEKINKSAEKFALLRKRGEHNNAQSPLN